jgi:hypothetical protein
MTSGMLCADRLAEQMKKSMPAAAVNLDVYI